MAKKQVRRHTSEGRLPGRQQDDDALLEAGPGAGDASSGGGAGSGVPGGGTDMRTQGTIPEGDAKKDRERLFPDEGDGHGRAGEV